MGVEMMGVMTAQPPLPVTPSGAVPFGAVAALVQDDDGGRVFIRGELCFVWDSGDEAGRRLTAVQLVRIKAASGIDVAGAFGVSVVTLWRWRKELDAAGAAGLGWHKRGPKGPSRLSDDMAADIRARRGGGRGGRRPCHRSTVKGPWVRVCASQVQPLRRRPAPCANAIA